LDTLFCDNKGTICSVYKRHKTPYTGYIFASVTRSNNKKVFKNNVAYISALYHFITIGECLNAKTIYGDNYLFSFNTIIVQGYVKEGKIEGLWQYYDRDTNLLATIHFENNVREGEYKYFYPLTGQLLRVGYCTHGVGTGEEISYTPDGKIGCMIIWKICKDRPTIKKYRDGHVIFGDNVTIVKKG
jgi:hypothetical protein